MKGTGDIAGALAELQRQKANGEILNYQKTADAFGVTRSRLSRRWRGITRCWEVFLDKEIRYLTTA